jgi:hypothetical protein
MGLRLVRVDYALSAAALLAKDHFKQFANALLHCRIAASATYQSSNPGHTSNNNSLPTASAF